MGIHDEKALYGHESDVLSRTNHIGLGRQNAVRTLQLNKMQTRAILADALRKIHVNQRFFAGFMSSVDLRFHRHDAGIQQKNHVNLGFQSRAEILLSSHSGRNRPLIK